MDCKNRSEIVIINETQDSDMSEIFGSVDHIGDNKAYDELHLSSPVLYKVSIESGMISLPQVSLINDRLRPDMLKSDSVYILDCWNDVFLWYGRESQKIVKEAARRVSNQIQRLFSRSHCEPTQMIQEGNEGYVFRSHFFGWDDLLEIGPKKVIPASKAKKLLTHEDFSLPKMEIENIFLTKQESLTDEHCETLLEAIEDYLDRMDCFVFENKTFNKLPDCERGHFYSNECYVFLCKMSIPEPLDDEDDEDEESNVKYNTKYRVFFWEGRSCSHTGFLTFAFTLKLKFESCFGDKLTVERIKQQQEPLEFLALFHPKFVIHRGSRKPPKTENASPRLYEIRNMMGMLTLRCVEIDLDPRLLCSRLHYILYVPKSEGGIIYLWIGKSANTNERNAADLIAQSLDMNNCFSILNAKENEEPDEFWNILGGKKEYDTEGSFLDFVRLFRCTNESGYYAMKEKYSDFCQDDLIQDDMMLLDDGKRIYLWEGQKASDIEVALTKKLAPVYAQNCKSLKVGYDREILYVKSEEEPIEFRRVFQGFDSRQIDSKFRK
ncbi:Protein flightless-1 [Thelohanellus kitauei]|uniref:Protein flightless-1 n=1 Tax=Thelohanellus kitauei TaxID=669202 RepID=A0A0C2N3E8_THEKT|nr:Protein flightless-1 [Thelohanellus kitauei]